MSKEIPKDFDWEFYLNQNVDLKNAGLRSEKDAIKHYLNHGQFECRLYYDVNNKIKFWKRNLEKPIIDGLNIYGFVNTDSGLGHNVRTIIESCVDIPHKINIIETSQKQTNYYIDQNSSMYNTNLIVYNPDFNLYSSIFNKMEGKYNIGLWVWELEDVPNKWVEVSNIFDEIWTVSDFCENTFKNCLPDKQIRRINIPADFKTTKDKNSCKKIFGVQDKFVMLFTFDGFSCIDRKNPKAVIDTFLNSKLNNDESVLIIKTQNLTKKEIKDNFSELPKNIFLINELWSKNKMTELFNSVDIYISLHRSEGSGLTIMEAIDLEIPVLCTNYSGNLDFCGDGCEFVDYKLIDIETKNCIYSDIPKKVKWAEVDLNDAVKKLEKIYNNYDYYKEKIKINKKELLNQYNIESVTKKIKQYIKL